MNENTITEENEDQEGHDKELPNSEPFDKELINESFRTSSDVTPRKLSDMVNRKLSDSDPRSNTLAFRDVMLSMIVPSSESGSDIESNSDEDDYMIVTNDTPEKTPEKTTPGPSPPFASDGDDDTPPQRPPRRHKTTSGKHSFERPIDSDCIRDLNSCNPEHRVTMETSDQQQVEDLVTAEVDGVDIDTIGNTDQVVSSIDQGEDMVILDVKGEAKGNVSDGSVELTLERKYSGASIEIVSDTDDGNLPRTNSVGSATGTSTTENNESVSDSTGIPSTETAVSTTDISSTDQIDIITVTPSTELVDSSTGIPSTESDTNVSDVPHKAANVSCDDMSMRLSLQFAQPPLDSSGSSFNQQTDVPLNEEDENTLEIEKDEEEEEEEEEMPCQPLGGGAVPLTRVKCVVSMTTPRDARAHGATDCPSFVEFDMSVDGFGCLFLPAIAPQVSAGKDISGYTFSENVHSFAS